MALAHELDKFLSTEHKTLNDNFNQHEANMAKLAAETKGRQREYKLEDHREHKEEIREYQHEHK